MRGGEGGVSALEPQLVHSTKQPGRGGVRRRGRREKSLKALEISTLSFNMEPKKTKGASGRSGFSQPEAASSSRRNGIPMSLSDRRPKRVRTEIVQVRSRLLCAEGSALSNGQGVCSAEGLERAGRISESVREERQGNTSGAGEDNIIPALHDEMGIQCLARLSRSEYGRLSMVCRKWHRLILSADIYKVRRSLGICEDWVFILGNNTSGRWRAYRPGPDDWLDIPQCPSDSTFDSCDKESVTAGLSLLVLGQSFAGYKVWRYDSVRTKWETAPKMISDRCLFGSSKLGQFAYFAGGTSRSVTLKSAERYNSLENRWEELPDLNTERKSCSGFVMDGKFFVIGGQNSHPLTSGEVYDPEANSWSVIENMWPGNNNMGSSVAPPLVAVLDNELYSIDVSCNMLQVYSKRQNTWSPLGKVPDRAEFSNGWGLGFKAVGDELFVIGGAIGPGQFLNAIHACRPRHGGDPDWRFVTELRLPTSGFIYNCAVMSG